MCVSVQGVHLKNKGDLPEEAVKPVPTVGMPFKLTGLLCCSANLHFASMAIDCTRCTLQQFNTVLILNSHLLSFVSWLHCSMSGDGWGRLFVV